MTAKKEYMCPVGHERREGAMTVKHTPGPWTYCGESHKKPCSCGHIWSKPADHPVAEVISGDWGDDYPAIRIKSPGSIGEKAEPYMEKMVYGSVDPDTAAANARLIAAAPENYQEHEQLILSVQKLLSTKWATSECQDQELCDIIAELDNQIEDSQTAIRKARGE